MLLNSDHILKIIIRKLEKVEGKYYTRTENIIPAKKFENKDCKSKNISF